MGPSSCPPQPTPGTSSEQTAVVSRTEFFLTPPKCITIKTVTEDLTSQDLKAVSLCPRNKKSDFVSDFEKPEISVCASQLENVCYTAQGAKSQTNKLTLSLNQCSFTKSVNFKSVYSEVELSVSEPVNLESVNPQ